jgi:type II secretory pathway component PulF
MPINFNKKGKEKWSRKETILFLERFEMYLSAGLPINKILPLLMNDKRPKQNLAITNILNNFQSGNLLSLSLVQYIGLPKTVAHMIEYGELSGKLSRSIALAIRLMTKEDELFKKCLNALLYPVFIGSFSLLLTIGLVQKVLSQIIPLLKSLHVELPIMTRIIISLSDYLKNYGLYTFAGSIILFFLTRQIYKKSLFVKKISHNFLMRIPVLGKVIYNYYLSLFLQSCGSLIESGLTVYEAYSKSQNSVDFIPIRFLLESHRDKLEQGIPLSKVFSQKRNPVFVQSLISAGESSGSLGISIIRAYDILDRDLDNFLKKFTTLVEPVMMIFMGLFVGTVATSIMVPIYNISSSLQR